MPTLFWYGGTRRVNRWDDRELLAVPEAVSGARKLHAHRGKCREAGGSPAEARPAAGLNHSHEHAGNTEYAQGHHLRPRLERESISRDSRLAPGRRVHGHLFAHPLQLGRLVPQRHRHLHTIVAEDVLKLETPLKKLIGSNFLILFPYLISVLIAMILGWADRVVTTAHVTSLPGPLKFIETIWPHRFAVLTGLAVLTLGLLLLQLSMGFGLDRAITEHVSGEFTEQLAATDLTDAAKQKIAISKGTALAKYRPETTTWLGIVVWLHILVILATAARAWLYRRGDKPLPKLTLQA
jgi:hypothetical protein